MNGQLKKLSAVSRERGVSVKMLRKAIKLGRLKSHRPGVGLHPNHFLNDQDVERWLNARNEGRLA